MDNKKLNTCLRQFNETIDEWVAYLDNYTMDRLCQRPEPESWSLGQVYVHLINDTDFFIGQMKVALADNTHDEEKMHETAKAMFRNNAFPDTRLDNPSNNLNLSQPQSKEELSRNLLRIKEEVNRLYKVFDFSVSRGKSEHPGFGYFNASEWLCFAEMHMRHHFRQKKRIDDT